MLFRPYEQISVFLILNFKTFNILNIQFTFLGSVFFYIFCFLCLYGWYLVSYHCMYTSVASRPKIRPNNSKQPEKNLGRVFGRISYFSRILAENSPNYQSSVLISILFTLGWPNLSNWDNVWLKTINSFAYDQHNVCHGVRVGEYYVKNVF